MINTVIRHIGTYKRKLEVEETQVMSFFEDDKGSFYLSPQERICRKYDQPTGKIKRITKSKKQLIQGLKETKGFSVSCHYSKDEIHEISLDKNVSLTYNQEDVKEGWVGRLKGLLQVLWERGYINTCELDMYTGDEKKTNKKMNLEK